MEFSPYKNSTLDSSTCLCFEEAGKSGSFNRSYRHLHEAGTACCSECAGGGVLGSGEKQAN